MIFQHTWEKVLSGEKTQTRRQIEDGNVISHPNGLIQVGNYRLGYTYAVQPGRNKPAVARIRITDFWREDVRNISPEDVRAEGFTSEVEFFLTWCRMHDKSLTLPIIPDYDTGAIVWNGMKDDLAARPSKFYYAWVLTFELVTPKP